MPHALSRGSRVRTLKPFKAESGHGGGVSVPVGVPGTVTLVDESRPSAQLIDQMGPGAYSPSRYLVRFEGVRGQVWIEDSDLQFKYVMKEGALSEATMSLVQRVAARHSLHKRAAVAKIPLYGRMFETHLTPKTIIKAVLAHYPNADPATFKWDKKLASYPNYGTMFYNWTMNSKPGSGLSEEAPAGGGLPDSVVSGSVIVALELNGEAIRSYAYLRIDN